jgi:hypothetical protein
MHELRHLREWKTRMEAERKDMEEVIGQHDLEQVLCFDIWAPVPESDPEWSCPFTSPGHGHEGRFYTHACTRANSCTHYHAHVRILQVAASSVSATLCTLSHRYSTGLECAFNLLNVPLPDHVPCTSVCVSDMSCFCVDVVCQHHSHSLGAGCTAEGAAGGDRPPHAPEQTPRCAAGIA